MANKFTKDEQLIILRQEVAELNALLRKASIMLKQSKRFVLPAPHSFRIATPTEVMFAERIDALLKEMTPAR